MGRPLASESEQEVEFIEPFKTCFSRHTKIDNCIERKQSTKGNLQIDFG